MTSLTYALLLCAVVTLVSAAQPTRDCFIDLNRVIGPQGSHVLLCTCRNGNGPFEIVGRVVADLPVGKADTVGREKGTLRCIEDNDQHLTQICLRNPLLFQTRALRTLRRCTKSQLNEAEQKQTERFSSFSMENCLSDFFPSVQPDPEAVWACKCIQPSSILYQVALRRASFLTEFAPTSPRREVELLRRCSQEFVEPLQRLCRQNNLDDYATGALQSLETCCKRVRSNSDAKFQCEDVRSR